MGKGSRGVCLTGYTHRSLRTLTQRVGKMWAFYRHSLITSRCGDDEGVLVAVRVGSAEDVQR